MKMMKIILLSLALISGGNLYADSCQVPKFIKNGVTFFTSYNGKGERYNVSIEILEIDRDSCWAKVKKIVNGSHELGTVWVNLKLIKQMTLP